MVLSLDLHTFLGFNGLVQTFTPAAARHQAAGEFVHDDNFAVLHHVVLVAVVQVIGPQRCIQMVHQRDVRWVIQRCALGQQTVCREDALCAFMPLFGQEHLVGFFVHREVTGLGHTLTRAGVGLPFLARHQRHHFVHGDVGRRVVFGLATDDQRRAGLVDQDRVHLVHDGVVQAVLHTVLHLVHHVVTQVIEAVFVVGTVGDVRAVRGLLFFARHVGQVDTHRQPQEVVQTAHPLRVTVGQVVVHGHNVNTLARQSVEVHRQGCGQRLAFTRAHFRNLAVVQRHAAQQLHIEMAHLHDTLGAFAHHGKRLGQQRIQRFPARNTVLELLRLGLQRRIVQLFKGWLQRIDAFNGFAELLDEPVIAAAENFGEDIGRHGYKAAPPFARMAIRRQPKPFR